MTDWMQASMKWQKSAAGRRRQQYKPPAGIVVAGEPSAKVAEYVESLAATRRAVWYPITPIAKPRMTQRDRWKKRPCVLQYWEFKDQCKEGRVAIPDHGGTVVFCLPYPKSYGATKRVFLECTRHELKPDVDNLLKALMDATKKHDQRVSDLHPYKIWSSKPGFFVIWPDSAREVI